MQEQKLIEAFSRIHGTRPFGADAEVVPFEGTNLLVSTDSFSEREDFLFGLEPEAMGRVMAYGAIADILACGAKPDFLVQAWNIDDSHDERFYEHVAQGVRAAAFSMRWRTSAASIPAYGLNWMRSAPFRRKLRGAFHLVWRRAGRSSAESVNTSLCSPLPPGRPSPMPSRSDVADSPRRVNAISASCTAERLATCLRHRRTIAQSRARTGWQKRHHTGLRFGDRLWKRFLLQVLAAISARTRRNTSRKRATASSERSIAISRNA